MGGGTTVGNPGDELTGNKVGIMGGSVLSSANNEPAPGTKKYIDGTPHVWVSGSGWVKDEGGGSRGTIAEDIYENGHKIGIMGGEESQKESAPPPAEQPEPTGDVIYIELQPTPTKNSTPPPYKPNTTTPSNQ